MTDYQKYQLQWMIDHGVSLQDLAKMLDEYASNICGDNDGVISKTLEDFLLDADFEGALWAHKDEQKEGE